MNNGIASIWKQLVIMDRIKEEIAGDMSRLIMMPDNDRWSHLPLVKEIDGFRILRAS
ncbi:hypothetical protein HFO26_31315 [Rhizobium leguminosarum]|uniref:hypothetical protein n=1 Tax=Rhizobium leguminosarum TaxID=384 RepID=UPI001C941100|nr:hypothetical protein [Rhizobium leguminosarum]MBY5565189.1 hypothetical protein [Rhizobium leguminosarum]MBY5734727.1 hypothetical protein [Rhizobium leguminosarum]